VHAANRTVHVYVIECVGGMTGLHMQYSAVKVTDEFDGCL